MGIQSQMPNRRQFVRTGLAGLAALPFGSGFNTDSLADEFAQASRFGHQPHFPARAKRVIFLFMLGGPSQYELFENKPKLREWDGQPISADLLAKMKFAQITEQRPSLLGTHLKFGRYGESGAEVSELLPHTARIVDELAIIKTMQTDEIPHHPAEVFLHTGTRMFGRPSLGA